MTTTTELDEKQLEALEIMRTTFKDMDGVGMPLDDACFLRYLRARVFKVKKAVKLLNESLVWRKEFGLADINEWKDIIKLENATGKSYIRGFDKEGHVLIYMVPAKENTHDHHNNMKHLVYTMERAIATMKHTTGMEKLSLIIDYAGYTSAHAPPMKTSRETLTILQSYYPERLYRAYAVRPPYIFHAFLSLVSPFIDSVTRKKICLLKDAEMNKEQNQLFDEVDRNILETSVGGADDRPFVSETYLNGPFEQDYAAILGNTAPVV
jgi:hypothetical protein